MSFSNQVDDPQIPIWQTLSKPRTLSHLFLKISPPGDLRQCYHYSRDSRERTLLEDDLRQLLQNDRCATLLRLRLRERDRYPAIAADSLIGSLIPSYNRSPIFRQIWLHGALGYISCFALR
jgi:hypothetical protein